MSFDKTFLKLYLVTDSLCIGGRRLEDCVEQAVKAGVTLVQLREKNLNDTDFISLAERIKKVTDSYNVPLIINDNINVAAAVDASGVHLGQGDINAKTARRLLGANKIIGVTAKNVQQAITAEYNSADYIGVGAVFKSATKADAVSINFAEAAKICSSVNIPAVAIGGINENNIARLKGLGFCGAAVVSAILANDDIYSASKCLLNLSNNIFYEGNTDK